MRDKEVTMTIESGEVRPPVFGLRVIRGACNVRVGDWRAARVEEIRENANGTWSFRGVTLTRANGGQGVFISRTETLRVDRYDDSLGAPCGCAPAADGGFPAGA